MKLETQEHTMVLAMPPAWTAQPLPCHGRWDEYDDPDEGRPIRDAHAAMLCKGCPMIDQCLTDALASESGGAATRNGVRGGMSARGRARLARQREVEATGMCPLPCGKHPYTEAIVVWRDGASPQCRITRDASNLAARAKRKARQGAVPMAS